jgi:hypothetical protein
MEVPLSKLRQMGIRPKVKTSAFATYPPQKLADPKRAADIMGPAPVASCEKNKPAGAEVRSRHGFWKAVGVAAIDLRGIFVASVGNSHGLSLVGPPEGAVPC